MRIRQNKNTWLIALGVFVAVFLFAFLTAKFKGGEDVEAADLGKFDPGYIISDYQMGNYNAMSEAEIQAFLTKKNPCNNTNYNYYLQLSSSSAATWHFANGHFVCLSEERFGDGETIGSGDTAAHIIWQTAQDYRINPQVLIVLLQKETGLITDPIPNNYDYRKATGYGCPDTAACSSKSYGFKNQVRNAAALFRTVLDGGWTNYPLGSNYIQYNPNSGCGGGWVNIRSLATSALYRYTPYQPNTAALSAGYGYGDSCSAYGNRNFYSYFEDWFGGVTSEKVDVGEPVGNVLSGQHTIISALSDDKVLDISGGVGSAKDGTNIQLWDANGTEAQIWEFAYNELDDTYNITNPATGKSLDVMNASSDNGTNIQLWSVHESCAQKWKITKIRQWYIFSSVCSSKVLDVSGAKSVGGTNIQIWELNGTLAQKWSLVDARSGTEKKNSDVKDNKSELVSMSLVESGQHTIISALSDDKVLDISGGVGSAKDGTNIQLWDANGTEAQIWEFAYNELDDTYNITNPATGKSLDVMNASSDNGTNIQLWSVHESCAQKWKLSKVGDDFMIISACSGKALDVANASTVRGTNIQLWNLNGNVAQKWKIRKV